MHNRKYVGEAPVHCSSRYQMTAIRSKDTCLLDSRVVSHRDELIGRTNMEPVNNHSEQIRLGSTLKPDLRTVGTADFRNKSIENILRVHQREFRHQ